MKPVYTRVELFNANNNLDMERLHNIINIEGESFKDIVQMEDIYLTIRRDTSIYVNELFDTAYQNIDINIGIASAVTAGGRITMSLVKNNPNFNLYYSDTDGAVIDKPLPVSLVGNKLGQFKLEYEIERGRRSLLAPKVYGFITDGGKEIIKVKGLTPKSVEGLHVSDLERLLVKNSTLTFNQEKWFKNLLLGKITVNEMAYQLSVTSNKRKAVYHTYVSNNGHEFDMFNATRPYYYSELESKNE